MDQSGYKLPPHKSLWVYFKEGLQRANAWRPVSSYLLLLTPLVLLLAYNLYLARRSPLQFFIFLSLLFLFLFAIMHRAFVDFFEIMRRNLREHQSLFGALGENPAQKTFAERNESSHKEE